MSTSPSRRSSKGFTLVELLVVIGIIALLISILLPSLNKARQAANATACLSNLRQSGIALQMYANENKGVLPDCVMYWNKRHAGLATYQYGTRSTGADFALYAFSFDNMTPASDPEPNLSTVWWRMLVPQLGLGKSLPEPIPPAATTPALTPREAPQIVRCPSDTVMLPRASSYSWRYALSYLAATDASHRPGPVKITNFKYASQTFILHESDLLYASRGHHYRPTAKSAYTNVLYADGHAGKFEVTDNTATANDERQIGFMWKGFSAAITASNYDPRVAYDD
jgi:prepilin-type N-terminal cleavage/methylation domain-containing protein/prepilin-type processing-associated H-X9-DG protein